MLTKKLLKPVLTKRKTIYVYTQQFDLFIKIQNYKIKSKINDNTNYKNSIIMKIIKK